MGLAEEIVNFKSGVIVSDKEGNAVHLCLFENECTERDIDNLKDEIRTDESFGLADKVDELVFRPMTEEELKMFKEEVKCEGFINEEEEQVH